MCFEAKQFFVGDSVALELELAHLVGERATLIDLARPVKASFSSPEAECLRCLFSPNTGQEGACSKLSHVWPIFISAHKRYCTAE